MAGRPRASKKEKIAKELGTTNEKLEILRQKCTALEAYKKELEEELVEIEKAEIKAAEEAKEKDLLTFIKKNNITKEQLQAFITAKESEA